MKRYRLYNDVLGWLCFVVAAVTYLMTVEPTASFWDCPEFISQGAKLEVGHPPGNPIFMLAARFFVNFAGGDMSKAALMVNSMSALLSAGTILLLFWTITHLTKRLIVKDDATEISLTKMLVIFGSGLCGALMYAWSDTFWFSAVEGEVYAFSSFCTALVFWLILKWENRADLPHSDRYLVLIAYIIGVSIAVHLLNLLCIPAIVLVIYYRKFRNTTATGSLIALAVSAAIIALILFGLVPGFIEVAQYFELFFVNVLGWSYNMGVLVYAVLLVAVMIWTIRELYRQRSANAIRWSFLLAVLLSGIPFIGSSLWIPVVLLIALAAWLWGTRKLPVRILTVAALSILVIFVGYSSYALLLIRSHANPPMNQNGPDNVFSLGSYLSREQYGETPLLYGQTFRSTVMYQLKDDGYSYDILRRPGKTIWSKAVKTSPDQPDSYVAHNDSYKYEMTPKMLFPRMYSTAGQHPRAYLEWIGATEADLETVETPVVVDQDGNTVQTAAVQRPSFAQNLAYFFNYQVNHMYWRYFMWNFAGRQNDIAGEGQPNRGNWISGISFIDNPRLGDQSLLPDEYGKGNKGHNVFYMLPLLMGIFGLSWQAFRSKRGIEQFWVIFFFFFMTGLAIVLYLNQPPLQPRERDYAFAGSFYAFAIWVGMGVAAVWTFVNWLLNNAEKTRLELAEKAAANPKAARSSAKKAQAVAWGTLALGIFVPLQVVSQTWDDHDRSGRYTTRDFGMNYLAGIAPNGIIFTNGDNDTFPLWYCQETEGLRTDARVCNLSYLQTDWYIDQMKRPAYDSPSVPIHWSRLQYVAGTREGISVRPNTLKQVIDYYKDNPELMREMLGDNPYELRNIIDKWVLNDNPELQIIPTDSIVLTIDKEAVRKSGMMMAADSIPDVMHISLKGKRAVYKSEMMMYEMLAQCNWTRPLYVAYTVGPSNYGALGDYFVQEGLAYRVTPFNTKQSGRDIDTDRMFDNMMHKYKFGGLEKEGLYIDETVMRMCYTHRRNFSRLAQSLLEENKADSAAQVVKYANQVLPAYNVPHNYPSGSLDLARVAIQVNLKEEAETMAMAVAQNASEYVEWYLSLPTNIMLLNDKELMYNMSILHSSIEVLQSAGSDKAAMYEQRLGTFNQSLQKIVSGL